MPAYFNQEFFDFLLELRYNNNRKWFLENKPRFEKTIKEPLLTFCTDFNPKLKKINDSYISDKSSIFRIYRDARFSHDKAPYKTHAACQFRFGGQRDVHRPAFYLHIEPGSCYVGGGLWRPAPDDLRRIRTAIARQDHTWLSLRKKLTISRGDTLKRMPKGFDADHPLADDIKLLSFTAGFSLSEDEIISDKVIEIVARQMKKVDPLIRFLNGVLP